MKKRGRPSLKSNYSDSFGQLIQSKLDNTSTSTDKKRGRQVGQMKKEIRIVDTVIHPYQISKDEHGYAVIDTSGQFEKKLIFPTTFNGCLRHIALLKTMEKQQIFSIKEYISNFEQVLTSFNNIVTI